MAHIVLENATKRYNGSEIAAVDHLSIECKDKEFLAILGPSGAGKTSTLKMIAGVEEISEGKLYIDGQDMTDVPSQNRNVSMVFESYALYPHLTVRENLAFPLKAPTRKQKLTKMEIDAKVEEWATIVGLNNLLDRKPSQLSGGQRQRVSLARALVRSPEPNVILMDEPIAHLDAKLRNGMRAELKRLHQDVGATIIYVTHDYVEAMAMADRIVVLNNGHMMQQGTPKEIYENPFHEFVASTVGEPPMNFLRGEIEKDKNDYHFIFKDETPLKLQFIPEKEGTVDLGIRPSEIKVCHEKPEENSFTGYIENILPTGAKQIMEVNVANTMVLVKVERDYSYHKGDMVHLLPDLGKVCFFDSNSKRRVAGKDGENCNG